MLVKLKQLKNSIKIKEGYKINKHNIKEYFLLKKQEKKEAYEYLLFFSYLNKIKFILDDLKKINKKRFKKIYNILKKIYKDEKNE